MDVEQDLRGIEMLPADDIPRDFSEQQPPSDPYVKLKMDPSFFKICLPSTTSETGKPPVMVDLCLPSYKSKSGMNYTNPFYDDPQFKETVLLVQEKLTRHSKDTIVLTGVSGGGKTSTQQHLELLCNVGQYTLIVLLRGNTVTTRGQNFRISE
ncbi:15364_t:CDS:2 [Acaulospora colombiana]|uniref:15364_t:CDS:1 n=1 Tax=Acaulospora colombiana TaxID=27376 RepID=A0ACA9MQ98_9GLOM|nr:15364_t:CDS:2 [Acaulospora colombiana]